MSFESHEGAAGHEYASPDDLHEVFTAMSAWLKLHGEHETASAPDISDNESIAPIYVSQARPGLFNEEYYSYRVTAEDLRQHAPEAVQELDVTGDVHFSYSPAYFQYNRATGAIDYYAATCTMSSETTDGGERDMSISVKQAADEAVVTSDKSKIGGREDQAAPADTPISLAEINTRMTEFFTNMLLEYQLGLNQLTVRECAALREIVLALEQLK